MTTKAYPAWTAPSQFGGPTTGAYMAATLTAHQHAAMEVFCPGCGSVVHVFPCVGVPHRTTLHYVEGHRFPRRSDVETTDCEWSHAYVFVKVELGRIPGPTAAAAERGVAPPVRITSETPKIRTLADVRKLKRNGGGRFPVQILGGTGVRLIMQGTKVVHRVDRMAKGEPDCCYLACRKAGLTVARAAVWTDKPVTCMTCDPTLKHGLARRIAEGCGCVRCEAARRGVPRLDIIKERMAVERAAKGNGA